MYNNRKSLYYLFLAILTVHSLKNNPLKAFYSLKEIINNN